MNSWIILLFLLFANRNGRDIDEPGCGCRPVDPPTSSCRPRERERERERDCECGREREAERDTCPCNNNESRFEPRFDARPFNNSGCGCDDK